MIPRHLLQILMRRKPWLWLSGAGSVIAEQIPLILNAIYTRRTLDVTYEAEELDVDYEAGTLDANPY